MLHALLYLIPYFVKFFPEPELLPYASPPDQLNITAPFGRFLESLIISINIGNRVSLIFRIISVISLSKEDRIDARAVDPRTMLHAMNDISLSASKGTDATMDATVYLLNYAHTNPNTEII